MSTILKALKKAEQESPEQENKSRSSLTLNVRTILNSRIQHQQQGFFLSQKGLIFILGAVLVIASVSYILFFPDKTIQPSIVDSQPPPAVAGQNVAVHKMESRSPGVEKALTPQEQDIKEKAPEQISQPLSKPGSRKEEILPLKDGILSVQAISWSKNPSDRIAVINTKIVGEGESVQGYDILEIGKDEVIVRLSDSDQKYRLAFKYQ